MAEQAQDIILKLLREKSSLKQDVFSKTLTTFNLLKKIVKEVADELRPKAAAIDKRLLIDYKERGESEIELRVAGDVLIFYMHSNVFEFDKSHRIWKTSYVRENEGMSYCGMINVYNFLNDSFKYNRANDIGYLIARMFLNAENHYFVEGKRQLGFLYNDFANSVIDAETIRRIVESTIVYCLDFDLFTPPFDAVKEVSVNEIMEASFANQFRTGKRLGFRFHADSDGIEGKAE